MSLKQLLGLDEAGISDFEIAKKLEEAQKHGLNEVDFVKHDGSVTKIYLPHVDFDPVLFMER